MPLQIHTGYGDPDLDLLGATLFRRALDRVLDDLLGTADLTADDAAHVRALVGRENGQRVYGL